MEIQPETPLARVSLDVSRHHSVVAQIGDSTLIDADILPGADVDSEHVFAQQHTVDEEGFAHTQWLRVTRHLHSCKDATVEFYDEHDKMIKGVGAFASVVGMVALGSIFVRHKRHRP